MTYVEYIALDKDFARRIALLQQDKEAHLKECFNIFKLIPEQMEPIETDTLLLPTKLKELIYNYYSTIEKPYIVVPKSLLPNRYKELKEYRIPQELRENLQKYVKTSALGYKLKISLVDTRPVVKH